MCLQIAKNDLEIKRLKQSKASASERVEGDLKVKETSEPQPPTSITGEGPVNLVMAMGG